MQIAASIIEKFNLLKEGKVYYGEFAKDTSFHAAVVKVPDELVRKIFTEPRKGSWIYCGRANLKSMAKKEFLDLLAKNRISFKGEVPEAFLAELKAAVKSSVTYSEQMLTDLGF